MNKKLAWALRLLSLSGGWLFLTVVLRCFPADALKFDIADSTQHAFPAPVITNVVCRRIHEYYGQQFRFRFCQSISGRSRVGIRPIIAMAAPACRAFVTRSTNPPATQDNPAPITVTVKGRRAIPRSYLFYPVVADLSGDGFWQQQLLPLKDAVRKQEGWRKRR